MNTPTSELPPKAPQGALPLLLLVVLIDLMGFTLVQPLLPPYAQRTGLSRTQVGMLLAAYPLCQLIAGPVLGRLSDRVGRRPILVLSQLGTSLSFLILGLTSDFRWMLLSRMLDGISGGNILVAQAYIADVTSPEHRSRSYGMLGAAFGIGFVLGPLLGGFLVRAPLPQPWNLRLPFLVGSVFSAAAFLLVLARLPEPRAGHAHAADRIPTFDAVKRLIRQPPLNRLLLISACAGLAFATLEGTFALYLKERLHWSESQAAWGFALLGLITVLIQGGAIRPLAARFAERKLVLTGLLVLSLGFLGLARFDQIAFVMPAIILVGCGRGLTDPSLLGWISRRTPLAQQGAVFGLISSIQMTARLINYLLANRLFDRYGPAAPYWEGACWAVLGCLAAAGAIAHDRSRAPSNESAQAAEPS
jgi:DHA1 family tetracycline resistance protein-like MFS transporter